MNRFWVLSLALALAGAASAADEFDGSRPMDCTPPQAHDCLPTKNACTPFKLEAGKDEIMHFDIASMSVKTPFRDDRLPITPLEFNSKSRS